MHLYSIRLLRNDRKEEKKLLNRKGENHFIDNDRISHMPRFITCYDGY